MPESGARVSLSPFLSGDARKQVVTVMIVLNYEYESRTPWSWKQLFSFISVNKKISLTLNCWMMEWLWAGDHGGWWCSLVCRQQLLVEVELMSFVLIHSQGQLWRPCRDMACTNLCLFAQGRGVPITEGTPNSLNPLIPAPSPKGLWSTSWNRDTSLWERTESSQISPQQSSALLAFSVAVGGGKVSTSWEPMRGVGSGVVFGKGAVWCLLLGTRRPS